MICAKFQRISMQYMKFTNENRHHRERDTGKAYIGKMQDSLNNHYNLSLPFQTKFFHQQTLI